MNLDSWLQISGKKIPSNRPVVSLCYAQSLNGSIGISGGAGRNRPLAISGEQSLALTHQLRAAHDAILVGIGTVLSDDPSLTVRFADGDSPQPVILDSQLRIPLDCKLVSAHPKRPWVATTATASLDRVAELEELGVRVWVLPEAGRVSLPALLKRLVDHGVRSLMVEGGARVLSSFLHQGLVDRVCVTIAPRFVAGIRVIEGLAPGVSLADLDDVVYERYGDDLVVFAKIYT